MLTNSHQQQLYLILTLTLTINSQMRLPFFASLIKIGKFKKSSGKILKASPPKNFFYNKSSREFSYPNKVIFTKVYTENSDEVASKSVATISNSKKSSLSDKTFTLSHYGLPEPDSEANSLFYLYLTGIFCLLGGSLVVFKFVFKKQIKEQYSMRLPLQHGKSPCHT